MDKSTSQRKQQLCTANQRQLLASTLYSRNLLTSLGTPIHKISRNEVKYSKIICIHTKAYSLAFTNQFEQMFF